MSRALKVSELLLELETILKQHNLWQLTAPSEAALASNQPFCIDTLEFHQWLQFIFITKMQRLIEQDLPLPQNLCLLPLAEEVYKNANFDGQPLFSVLSRIDEVFK